MAIRAAKQAMLHDPLVGAVCEPEEVWQMTDEMLVAGEEWLPQYAAAIADAKHRLATGPLVPTRDYAGAARLPVKTLEEMEERAAENRKRANETDKAKTKA